MQSLWQKVEKICNVVEETNFVAPVTIRVATICIISNSFASYKLQLSQTASKYSIIGLIENLNVSHGSGSTIWRVFEWYNAIFSWTAQNYIIFNITKTYLYNFDPLKIQLLYSKTGVYKGIHYFSYFCSKT